ncbi:hypothetical protein ABZ815_24235 [Nonomuraea sp. NPDC047529]|uniref:MmyB family transcriptional regulator n=1 Tax=Nonomuraea sp. NPDC047529 TaxID=3155623 RepID=UPI0033D904C6
MRAEAGREPHDRALRTSSVSCPRSAPSSAASGPWHPQIGDLELTYQSLDLPVSSRTVYGLTVYTAEPGSTSEGRPKLLASLAAIQRAHPTSQPR